ncbi:heavy-metal-associated domain-containing protein, partial [Candidatus Woesebacteria bacterium]|nr:heavy-metal-associated domain-containing protein [Candidatus Woesebacteria bacterium]
MSNDNHSLSLNIEGMHCASCANTIKRKLEKLDGVQSCVVNYGTEKAKIEFDPTKTSISQMNQEVGKLGYSLTADKQISHTTMDKSKT